MKTLAQCETELVEWREALKIARKMRDEADEDARNGANRGARPMRMIEIAEFQHVNVAHIVETQYIPSTCTIRIVTVTGAAHHFGSKTADDYRLLKSRLAGD